MPAPDRPPPVRLVLDTNVWLDLLVFRDPNVSALHDALATGEACAFVDDAALAELARVLAYPALRLDTPARARVLAAVAGLSTHAIRGPAGQPLPRCRDPDDQCFVELAAACHADHLLSRDAELLRLSARLQRLGLCSVLTPSAWCALRSRTGTTA